LSERVAISSQGADSKLGGIAGRNTGSLVGGKVIDLALAVNGANAAAGGAVGLSEQLADAAEPVIEKVLVTLNEDGEDTPTLLTVKAENARAGGIVGLAKHTQILEPLLIHDFDTLIVKLEAEGAQAGGIAGRAEDSKIVGDATKANVQNLQISTNNTAKNAYVGGIVGYNDQTLLNQAVGSKVTLSLSGSKTVAGGMAGYNRGSQTAVIANVHVTDLGIMVNADATVSTIGGFVGINDTRADESTVAPEEAVSSIQKSRYTGSTRTSTSQAINVLATDAVVGGMVGENRSFIANNSITDKVKLTLNAENGKIGGLIGLNTATGTVYYTSSNAALSIAKQNVLAGGLVALNEGKVLSSFTESDITSSAFGAAGKPIALGGLIGHNKGTVEKSYSSAKVTANGVYTYAGGLIGEQTAGSVKDTYVLKDVTATKANSYAGGYIGRITGGKVENGYSTAKVTASGDAIAGGFAGRYDNTSKDLLSKLFYVSDTENAINLGLSDFGDGQMRWMQSKPRLDTITLKGLENRSGFKTQSGWDFEQIWKYGSLQAAFQYPELIRTANSGNGGGSDVNANINWYTNDIGKNDFQITSESELAGLAAIVNGTVPGLKDFNFQGRTITLTGPIHIQSSQWVPIGFDEQHPFQGTFDGDGHLIDGLTVIPDHSYSGLFGHIGEYAEVQNIVLEPLSVAGKLHTGVLAGFNEGTINDVTINLLKGAKVSGGIVGSFLGSNSEKGTFENVTVNVSEDSRIEAAYPQSIAGGLIGENWSDFTPEMFKLNVVKGSVGSLAAEATVGGIVGKHHADATGFQVDITAGYNISAEGDNSIVGGLIGHYESGHGEQLAVTFKDGTLQAFGQNSVLGGLIGYSGAGNTLRDMKASSATSIRHLAGDGIVGALIGSKLGSDSDSFDVEQAVVENIKITSLATSEKAIVGGIAGKLENTAVHNVSFKASIEAEGGNAVAGGIVGHALNSIIYKANSVPSIVVKGAAQEGIAGGIAGIIASSDADARDEAHDFGLWAPLYHGIYDAKVEAGTVRTAGVTAGAADLYAGGIVGKNIHASIYQSGAKPNVVTSGGKLASAGGIAGYNNGMIIRTTAQNKVEGDTSAVYNLGGVVGWSVGGNIQYTKQVAPAGAAVKAGSAAAVAGTVPTTSIGGFAGKVDKTTIAYSSTDIAVDVTDTNLDNSIHAGGFVGLLGEDTEAMFKLEHAFAKGQVIVRSKTGASVGGFVGSADFYAITDVHAAGAVTVSGNEIRAGGFAGTIEQKAVVKQSLAVAAKIDATGSASGDRVYAGGFAGYNDGKVSESYTGVATINANPTGANTLKGALVGFQFRDGKLNDNQYAAVLGATGYNGGTVADNAQEVIASPLASGDWDYEYDTYFLSENHTGEVTIATVKQLTGAIRLYNNATGLEYYKLYNRAATDKLDMPKLTLTADLDLTGLRITPFDHFSDLFDGQGHTLKGFKLVVSGDHAVGFFTENDGEIANIRFDQFEISGGTSTGFVTGYNKEDGIIRQVNVRGTLQGEGAIGGIAGVNEGDIIEAYARGELSSDVETAKIAAGGIAGLNEGNATISRSFSFMNIDLSADEAAGGGIAGVNRGHIANSFNSGYVLVDGQTRAWSGGIAGYATAGTISGSLNAGEAIAGFDAEITPGSHFFGGIAGQLGQNATLAGNVYDKQMLKRNTAYYDENGNRVVSTPNAAGLSTAVLVDGTLPAALSAADWKATAGFYPRLIAFDGNSAANVGAAAVILNQRDAINRIVYSFALTRSANLSWTGEAGKVSIYNSGAQTLGNLLSKGIVKLTAAFGDERRNIYINDPAWKFKQIALAPTVVSGNTNFTETVTVELATNEPGGRTYYTTDGSYPTEDSPEYTEPLVFDKTTQLKAVTIVDTKEDSPLLSGTWSKAVPNTGGGVFFPVQPTPTPAPAIVATAGKTTADSTAEAPVKVARNSKLTLSAPEGQIIYYTTDGSTPTKNSPQYKGELLVTGNMTIKAITDKDDRVITIKYEVEKAQFELREKANEIKYMTGYKDGTFKPEAAMTRLELIHALSPLLDQEDVNLGTLFTDVKASEKDAVAFFASAGIIEGYPNGTFGGEKGLTRAEFTVILSRVLKLDVKATGKSTLNDVKGHWAEKYINAFTAAGYVKGFPDGSFKPEKEISRAEAVIVINKMIGTKKAKLPASFSDLKPTHWAYEDIMAVTQ
jgi:fibronectin-binding autotransporter adhesin